MSKRRKFSAEFKREAVQLATMPDVTLRQVAQDLGINEGLLGRALQVSPSGFYDWRARPPSARTQSNQKR